MNAYVLILENEISDSGLQPRSTKQPKRTNNIVNNTINNRIHHPQQQSSYTSTSSAQSSNNYFYVDDEDSQKLVHVNTPTSLLSPNTNFIDDFESPFSTPRTPPVVRTASPLTRPRYLANAISPTNLPSCDPQYWKNKEASLDIQSMDVLVFNPNKLEPEEVKKFERFCAQVVQGQRNLNMDRVIAVLHSHDYNVEEAKRYVSKNPLSVKRQGLFIFLLSIFNPLTFFF